MKLKYYLRTLGIGIFVTALILTVSSMLHGVSDEEVIQRAKALGLTEAKNQVLSDLREQQNTEPSKEPGKTVPSVLEQEESGQETEESTNASEPVEESRRETQPESTAEESVGTTETEETAEPVENVQESSVQSEPEVIDEMVKIVIARGDSSRIVSQKLYEAGLVSSAAEFDSFLCNNRYDYGIRTGTYQIPGGSTEEQIAKIITGN